MLFWLASPAFSIRSQGLLRPQPQQPNIVSVLSHREARPAAAPPVFFDKANLAEVAFEDAIRRCESIKYGGGTSSKDLMAFLEVPALLRTVFDADEQYYMSDTRPAASVQNLTCTRPVLDVDWRPGGAIRGADLMDVKIEPGRACAAGQCSGTCSRVAVPDFASHSECEELCKLASEIMEPLMPEDIDPDEEMCALAGLPQLDLCSVAAFGEPRLMLLAVRLVERLRRAVAREYGLPLSTVAPHTSYISRWVADGGCGDGTPVHGDEAACPEFHYSAVLHLNSQGEAFEGGDFVFSDAPADVSPCGSGCGCTTASPLTPDAVVMNGDDTAADEAVEKSTAGRRLTRMAPQAGRAIIFSSGWENLHYVERVKGGVRQAMPTFFVTRDEFNTDGVGEDGSLQCTDVANAFLNLIVAPESEEDRGQLTFNWHSLFGAQLSELPPLSESEQHELHGVTAMTIPTMPLNTGASMPALAFGTYQLDGEELHEALSCAIAAGYRAFDTSAGYENEHVVATAIAESGIPREAFFITTKLWCTDHGGEETFDAILRSLAQLDTTYVDMYLMHAPNNLGEDAAEIVELRRQSWLVMEEFHRNGVLRAIGVSNFEPRHIEDLLTLPREEGVAPVTPAVNQVECHAHLGQSELRKYCVERDILVQAYGSIGSSDLLADDKVRRVARARGRSAAQITLRHGLDRGCAVLARSTTPSRIAENAQIFDFGLEEDEVRALDALECGGRQYWDNSKVP